MKKRRVCVCVCVCVWKLMRKNGSRTFSLFFPSLLPDSLIPSPASFFITSYECVCVCVCVFCSCLLFLSLFAIQPGVISIKSAAREAKGGEKRRKLTKKRGEREREREKCERVRVRTVSRRGIDTRRVWCENEEDVRKWSYVMKGERRSRKRDRKRIGKIEMRRKEGEKRTRNKKR